MKEGFKIWIPDDAEIQVINISIVVKDKKTNGVTFFYPSENDIKDCNEWYFTTESKPLPVKNGEC